MFKRIAALVIILAVFVLSVNATKAALSDQITILDFTISTASDFITPASFPVE